MNYTAAASVNVNDFLRDGPKGEAPPKPAPSGVSCKGQCGGNVDKKCYCDSSCQDHKDCCEDFVSVCGNQPEPTLSCNNNCGEVLKWNQKECSCKNNCDVEGNCCEDKGQYCSTQKECMKGMGESCIQDDNFKCCKVGACVNNVCINKYPFLHGSCAGACNGRSKTGNCMCDKSCKTYKDCCTDYGQKC